MAWTKIADVADLAVDEIKGFVIQGHEFALYRLEDGYYVTDGLCTHADRSLVRGWVQRGTVTCPRHGGKFDIRTGDACGAPCVVPLQTYPVEVRDEEIWVEIQDA